MKRQHYFTAFVVCLLIQSCVPRSSVSSTTTPEESVNLTATPALIATALSIPTPTSTLIPIIQPTTISTRPDATVAQFPGTRDIRAYRGVAWAPDGKQFALSGDGGVYLFKLATLQSEMWSQSNGVVRSISINPDGHSLLAEDGKIVQLWNLDAHQMEKTFSNHTDEILAVSFNLTGKEFASTGMDNLITVFETSTGKSISTMKGHTDWVVALSFSSDNSTLASASMDGTIQLWDIASGANKGSVSTTPKSEMYTVAFAPSGSEFAGGGADGMIHIWDDQTLRSKAEFYGDCVIVTSLSYSPDGKILAWGGLDGRIRLWDTATQSIKTVLSGHDGTVLNSAFSPDGKLLLSVGSDGTAKLWNLSSIMDR